MDILIEVGKQVPALTILTVFVVMVIRAFEKMHSAHRSEILSVNEAHRAEMVRMSTAHRAEMVASHREWRGVLDRVQGENHRGLEKILDRLPK